MIKKVSFLILFVLLCINIYPQGTTFAFQFSIGIQGAFSFTEMGIIFPTIGDNFFIGLKARAMSSLTWATFIHQDGRSVSLHPVVLAGALSFGGYSPFIDSRFRMYGGMDMLLGYSFTPYDSAIYETGNLIGDNVTFGFFGFFGMEVFTAEKISYYIDSGGGYKGMFCDKSNLYAIASSWLGSGFGIKNGMRFYY
ncbi:MAG: hypothetical protein JW969_17890 [Spirochaetales bacterium]|nr:hypothetical protein [Spirochaetales bacterium]